MPSRFVFCLLALFAVGLTGCQAPTADSAKSPTEEALRTATPVHLYNFATPEGLPRAGEAYDRLSKDGMADGVALLVHFDASQGRPAAEQVAAARAALDALGETPHRYMTEQVLGVLLLNEFLAGGALTTTPAAVLAERSLSREAQTVVGFATELLLRNRYHNADLMAAGLRSLQGYWPAERIAAAAREALTAAEAYLAGLPAAKAAAPRDAALREGLVALQRLAQ